MTEFIDKINYVKRGRFMIEYCRKCVMPATKPDLLIDQDGVCNACRSFENRVEIDWDRRREEFVAIVDRYRDRTNRKWDCIVPVSGGKDSTIQVLKMLELGLRPLCVTSTTCDLSPIGRANIENIKNLGVDYVEFSPNPKVRRLLNKVSLEHVGDIQWPEHVGVFTIPARAAVQYDVPLIVWGENPQNEYGGPAAAADGKVLDRKWMEEFGGFLGMRVSDMPGLEGLREGDLAPYQYPNDDELSRTGVTGLFLGHYFPWDGLANAVLAQANGFKTFGTAVEGSMDSYENLDNFQHHIHDYIKFLKYGYGRATDQASMHLRRNRITREQALKIVRSREGKFPWTYMGKPLEEILAPIDVSVDKFKDICDQFTNHTLFKVTRSGDLSRDSDGNLIKINYDNE